MNLKKKPPFPLLCHYNFILAGFQQHTVQQKTGTMTSPHYLQQNQLEDCQKTHIINAKIFKSAPRDVSACCLLWYTGASSIVMPLESTTQKLSVTHKLSFDVTKEGTQTLLALSSVLIDFKGNFKSTEMHMYRPWNY